MPTQFVDVVTITPSPTTFALQHKDKPCLNECQKSLSRCGTRSHSLSKLSRRASTSSVLTATNEQRDTFHTEETEWQQQQHMRHARRALSSGTGTSLSLLQEELGYPRRAKVANDGHQQRRRSSLFETVLDTNNKLLKGSSTSQSSDREIQSNSMSSSGSLTSTSEILCTQLVSEVETDDHMQALTQCCSGRSWTFNSTTCSQQSDTGRESQDVQDDEENFMNYRSASVTGYSCDTDGIVYYEVIVRSIAHGPLSAYKVRRRYSEFRDLHVALSKIMPVSYGKLASATAMASISDESNNINEDEDMLVGLRHSVTDCGEDKEPTLPPLPDKGGVWSYLQFDSIPLLERRAKYFHAMLTAAQRHPVARASRLLNDFVGTPPDLVSMHSSVENSYVSLNRFAAPKLSFDIEIQERKEKAKCIRRRRSSLKRQTFTGSLDGSFTNLLPLQ